MARSAKRGTNVAPEPVKDERLAEQKSEIIGVLLIGLALLAMVAIVFEGAGVVGTIMRSTIHYLFGYGGSWMIIIYLAVNGWSLMSWRRERLSLRYFMALSMLFGMAFVLLQLASWSPATATGPNPAGGGGVIGELLTLNLLNWFGPWGLLVIGLIWLMVLLILALDRPLLELLRQFFNKQRHHSKTTNDPNLATEGPTQSFSNPEFDAEPLPDHSGAKVVAFPGPPRPNGSVISSLQNLLREPGPEKSKPLVNVEPISSTEPLALGPYKLPGVNLLGPYGARQKKTGRLLDQSRKLEETLAHFGVNARVIEVHYGPVITRYDLQPAPGVKVSRIVNLSDDLALALAAKGLRLEAPIPGKAAIGIEVPHPEPQLVTFRDVLDSKTFWNSGKMGLLLGMDIAGEVVVADLKRMPHLLIAGATGSGKSVCINTLIMSILFKAFPDEVKLIMIDPKMVELSIFSGIPHLMAPVVTEVKKAAATLKLVLEEMDRRYRCFAEVRVRDIEKYNEQALPGELLPYIIVIIDELADLMMVAPVEVEDAICRLAQMARATGIHLVVATQRPSVDVITGLIKANIPSRIAFAVSSQVDSRTILDGAGAERLLGRGDMLFAPVGTMKPRRIQGALVTEKELEAVIKHWREQGGPKYQDEFIRIPDQAAALPEATDQLFWDAARIVAEYGHASASILQRRLRVGYTRAARLVDMLEAKGMVGPYEGSKPREVYINLRQLEELKKRDL